MEYTDALEYLKILRNLVDITEHDSGAELQKQTYDVAIESVEKQIPKKPKPRIVRDVSSDYCCPNCGEIVTDNEDSIEYINKYCPNCGQAIDWSEEVEEC